MKTLASLLLISVSLAGTAAYAYEPSGELDYPPAVEQTSSLTRAEVVAELQAARAAGQVTFGETEQAAVVPSGPSPSRAEVQAQAQQAQARGDYAFGELDYQASVPHA